MIVNAGVKTTGEHWDEDLGLYLDVTAEVQKYPFWWDEEPKVYQDLLAKRADAGIAVEDELFHWSDLDEPYDWDEDDDE